MIYDAIYNQIFRINKITGGMFISYGVNNVSKEPDPIVYFTFFNSQNDDFYFESEMLIKK